MSAPLKPIHGRHLRGMHQLESKILDLQNQYQSLLKERQQEITHLLSAIGLAHLDDHTLLGGLLFLKEKTTSQDATNKSLVEAWRDAGEKFLRQHKPKTVFQRHEQAGGKQANACSRIPDKKVSPKQTATPQATAQPPQKPPQSREE